MLRRRRASMTVRAAALFCSATVPRALKVMVMRIRPAMYQRCFANEQKSVNRCKFLEDGSVHLLPDR